MATITGRLIDSKGTPLTGATLYFNRLSVASVITRNSVPVVTNGSGAFSLTLEPGQYLMLYDDDKLKCTVGTNTSYTISEIIDLDQS